MIERGSIIVDLDLAKVAEIRTVLEARWGEKVQIAEVLTDLLVKDEMDYRVGHYAEAEEKRRHEEVVEKIIEKIDKTEEERRHDEAERRYGSFF